MKHDIRIDRSKLHPQLDFKLGKLLQKCSQKGIYLIVTEGYRTKEYQDELYAKGRTAPGSIVTWARGKDNSSQHQWHIAFDICLKYDVDGDGKVSDDTWNTKGFDKVAKIAKKLGLGWGGDWTTPDRPHFYLKKWGSTVSRLKILYGSPENFKDSWTKRVTKKNGLKLWKNVAKTKSLAVIPKNDQVKVLHTKLWYAKVKYKGHIGFVNKKYLI